MRHQHHRRRSPLAFAAAVLLITSACSASDEAASEDTASVADASDSAASTAPTTPDATAQQSDPPSFIEDDETPKVPTAPGRPSKLLSVVSVLTFSDADDRSRTLGELTRCVAVGVDDATVAAASEFTYSTREEGLATIGELDAAALAAVTARLDECLPAPALLALETWSSRVERDEFWSALCLADRFGEEFTWARVAAEATDLVDPFWELAAEPDTDSCGDFQGIDTLTEEQEALVDDLRGLGRSLGMDFGSDEFRCVVAGLTDQVDASTASDLDELDLESLRPVFELMDQCVPLAGVLAETEGLGGVSTFCAHRELAGVVGWAEVAELAKRRNALDGDVPADDPVLASISAARAACTWSDPVDTIAELGEIIEIGTLVHDGERLWAGGIDEGGGEQPGNVVALDPATGAITSSFDTEIFSVEIIESDGSTVWVSNGGERLQRLRPEEGIADALIVFNGREIGDLQLAGGSLWATDNLTGSLLQLDPEDGTLLDERAVAPLEWYSSDLLLAAGSLWLTDREEPIVRQLDPVTGESIAEYTVRSEYTMNLLDLGTRVGVYGFGELWTITPGEADAEFVVEDFEGLDPDLAVAIGQRVVFANEDSPYMAEMNLDTVFVESMHATLGQVNGDPRLITTDGTDVWTATFGDDLLRLTRS